VNFIAVFLGGGCGSLLRYLMSLLFKNSAFHWATLSSNLLSSILLGFLIAFYEKNQKPTDLLYLFIGMGLCGGFSTFSTFSLENYQLFKDAHYNLLILNVALNILLCFLGVYFGYKWIK